MTPASSMNQAFLDYYRCPAEYADFRAENADLKRTGSEYFRFSADVMCYGSRQIDVQQESQGALLDVSSQVRIEGSTCYLPFDPTEVANNLRYERYVQKVSSSRSTRLIRDAYYCIRPLLPVKVRRHLQRTSLQGWNKRSFPTWPVDRSVDQMFEKLMSLSVEANQPAEIPFIWFWPEGKSSCAIVTHDVETIAGLNFVGELMDLNDSFGIKSSFQIIPEGRYSVSEDTLAAIRSRGFEINVHDLRHDGHLFDERERFLKAAEKINKHSERWGTRGFRSGILYRNVDWYDAFSFSYDMSVPNTGHLDPQWGGCCTVMPFFVGEVLELPVTTIQDYSLFHILARYSIDLWREQIAHIMQQHGLISFIIHPDYLNTNKARNTYSALLGHLSELRMNQGLWIALPGDVDIWWRQRACMKLVKKQDIWKIEGPGSRSARVAFASCSGGQLQYRLQ
jgi:hypothetical protein